MGDEPRQVQAIFATLGDMSFVERWRETLGAKPEAIQREAVDLAQLARDRYYADSKVGQHYLVSREDFGHQIKQDPDCEIAGLLLLKCDWFSNSNVIGVCHFRRTWCSNIVLDYLVAHPLTLVAADNPQNKTSGIGTVMLCFLSRIAMENSCNHIWGEATKTSCDYYKKLFALESVKDLFVIPEKNYSSCANRKLDWQTGRPITMTSNAIGTLLSGVKYDAFGQPTEYVQGADVGNGVKTTIGYGVSGRLASKIAVTNGGSGTTRYNLSLDYYPNGNIYHANDGVAWTHSYDAVNRLTSSASSGNAFSFTYDKFGNRLTQTITPSGPNQSLGTHDTGNHIPSGNPADVTYDALGNVRTENYQGTVRTYTYDGENRLTKIEASGATVVEYVYDAFGRRIRKTNASPAREYYYDLGGRMVIEVSGVTGGWWASEYYAGGLHLGTFTNGQPYYSHQDYLGTERIKTDQNGAVAQTCTYGPFGDNESCTGAINSMVKYAGYERDPESGLDHMWFRYYNPRLGRFMTTDPSTGSIDPTDTLSLNRYSYVQDNPVNFFDPLGLDAFKFVGNCIYISRSYSDQYVTEDGTIGTNVYWGPWEVYFCGSTPGGRGNGGDTGGGGGGGGTAVDNRPLCIVQFGVRHPEGSRRPNTRFRIDSGVNRKPSTRVGYADTDSRF